MGTDEFIAANTEAITKFAEIMMANAATLNGDRDLALEVATTELGFEPAQLENAFVQLQGDSPITAENLKKIGDLALHYEILEEAPNYEDLFFNVG